MNAEAGPVIVSVVGVVTGTVCHIFCRRFWLASALATFTAAVLWIGGCLLLFALTAPNELGGPLLLTPVLLTVAKAFLAALAAGGSQLCPSISGHAGRCRC